MNHRVTMMRVTNAMPHATETREISDPDDGVFHCLQSEEISQAALASLSSNLGEFWWCYPKGYAQRAMPGGEGELEVHDW